jgi:quercetin dioxygenase-like cupin family protein
MTEKAEAGDMLFIVKRKIHGVRNAGDSPRAYFALVIGGDINRQTKEKNGWQQ